MDGALGAEGNILDIGADVVVKRSFNIEIPFFMSCSATKTSYQNQQSNYSSRALQRFAWRLRFYRNWRWLGQGALCGDNGGSEVDRGLVVRRVGGKDHEVVCISMELLSRVKL